MKIKYLDMFAGAGGFRTGLKNAGDFFIPVGWCEIDRFAQKAYRALYETDGEYFCDDARQINTNDVPDIDLICAGFPCQPFSVSGRRLGFDDTRGTLFHEYLQTLRSKVMWHEARRPAYLLLENVPGLLNHEGGKTFGVIISALHELGYGLEWSCAALRKRNAYSANFGSLRRDWCRNKDGEYIIVALRCGEVLISLIADCPEKYFLSPRATARLLSRLYPEDKDKECTPQKEQAHV